MDTDHRHGTRRTWIFMLCLLIILDCYFHVQVYYNILHTPPEKIKVYEIFEKNYPRDATKVYYKYPLVTGLDAYMDYENGFNSSYYWFTSMQRFFKDIRADASPMYPKDTPLCKLNTSFEPIKVTKTEPKLYWIEQQNPDVKLGGYYAPAHCRATNKVAIIIPYRDRRVNLKILLRYLHPLLQKQLLEYRIFVVEQFGSEKFNKGSLYNIAFLETQRFGAWHCLVFHNVDLVPEHEGISYSCPEHPTQMSPTVEFIRFRDFFRITFGGVIALTPKHYEAANGYSNSYWGSGAVDEDFCDRLFLTNEGIGRYKNSSITRYATLPHLAEDEFIKRPQRLYPPPFQTEGLRSTKYNLLNITQEKLYTHILADVGPMKIKEDTKTLIQRLERLNNPYKIIKE